MSLSIRLDMDFSIGTPRLCLKLFRTFTLLMIKITVLFANAFDTIDQNILLQKLCYHYMLGHFSTINKKLFMEYCGDSYLSPNPSHQLCHKALFKVPLNFAVVLIILLMSKFADLSLCWWYTDLIAINLTFFLMSYNNETLYRLQ